MKGIINRNKCKLTQSRLKLSNGQVTDYKQIMSEKFNNFFISIGPNLANKIPNQTKSPLPYLGDRLPNTIILEPVSDEEVEGMVNNLKNSAPGYDEITASIPYQLSEVHWLIYLNCLCCKLCFGMSWKLLMCCLNTRQMTIYYSITIGQCLCDQCYQRSIN